MKSGEWGVGIQVRGWAGKENDGSIAEGTMNQEYERCNRRARGRDKGSSR